MSSNDFIELYKTWETERLLDIVDSPHDYQLLAVDAARSELDKRQLSEKQLENAKKIQANRKAEKANKLQKVKAIENRIKSVGSSFAETLNPIQREAPTTEKYIKIISIFLGGLSLFQFYKEFGMLRFMLTDSPSHWELSMIFYFLPLFVVPAAGILMWLRKKYGWVLSTLFFSYTAMGAIPLFISALNRKLTGNIEFDNLFPIVPPANYIVTFLLFSGATLIMAKERIREIYNISKQAMFITVGLGTVIIILMTLII